jgi:hypothetical protein
MVQFKFRCLVLHLPSDKKVVSSVFVRFVRRFFPAQYLLWTTITVRTPGEQVKVIDANFLHPRINQLWVVPHVALRQTPRE